MKEAIRRRALELGFDDCHFTTARRPDHAEHFQQWLAGQNHGEMAWIERNSHKRIDPQEVLPGAKSIIVLATSYARDEWSRELLRNAELNLANASSPQPSPPLRGREGERAPGQPEINDALRVPESPTKPIRHSSLDIAPTGTIARYARYTDYHDVLAAQLRTLTEFVDVATDHKVRSLWYVDTGPLLERDLAQRAGLGFVGKHTNLISRKLGNWFFLSEIITTLELEPDTPEKNRCGTCTRCLTACPTNAIPAPFQLDARRCISYLTIELKGPIPVELRPAIGNRIYGCDDCLAACPWNKFAREGSVMKQHARSELATPDLIELLALDNAGFKQRFAGTPILRTKRRGLLRNVCVALGNAGDKAALPALEKAAQDPEPLIAEHARWAIEQLNRNTL